VRLLSILGFGACAPLVSSVETDSAIEDSDLDSDPLPASFADLPAGTWSFVPVDGMVCGNGAPTGIGVNPGSDPTRLMVLVAGGGACWDALTCYILRSAVNVEASWGANQMASETAGLTRDALAPLTSAAPDLAEATWIYVPYCTGDLHAGSTVQAYDAFNPNRKLHHAGDANFQAWIDAVQSEMPGVSKLWAIGFSAGGYGVQLQADKFATAWPGAEGALFADCAPMVTPYGGRLGEWQRAWDLRAPEGCDACLSSFPAYLDDARARMPSWRLGLAATDQDAVITVFASYPAGSLGPAVHKLVADHYAPHAQASAFVKAGTDHVILGNAAGTSSRGGVNLLTWFGNFLAGPAPADAP
jgi:hypothetical protein